MTPRCVVMGDVMMDISAVIDEDIAYGSDTPARIAMHPGGVAANTAAWMALSGETATLVGCVGPDAFGQSIRLRLGDAGVDVHLEEGSLTTGSCVVIVDRRRERTMFPEAGANGELTSSTVQSLVTSGDHLHLSGYTFLNPATRAVALTALRHARAVGASTSLDPASAGPLRAHRELFMSVLTSIDLLLANEAEASVLTGHDDPHRALEDLTDHVACAVVKLGARGALALDDRGLVDSPATATTVVDTTGAGDAFTAGFLPAWLRKEPLSVAVRRGQDIAAQAVARVGASPLTPG